MNGLEKESNGTTIVRMTINRLLNENSIRDAKSNLNFGDELHCTKPGEKRKLDMGEGTEEPKNKRKRGISLTAPRQKSNRLNIDYSKKTT